MMHASIGIGLRGPHYQDILHQRPDIGFLEIHAENFFGGGKTLHYLDKVRQRYPISIHGVGLSLGSADGLDKAHLNRLKVLAERVQPLLISEHLSWSSIDGTYVNDLLPLPYTEEALKVMCRNIQQMQEALGRTILIENPSIYMALPHQEMSETAFLREVVTRTGCQLLLDVNNIYVTSHNLQGSSEEYMQDIPWEAVAEIHLAGHSTVTQNQETVLIDDHGSRVRDEVWVLYETALQHVGERDCYTLIEWDTDVPMLDILLAEASKASEYTLNRHFQDAAYG